MKKKIRILQIPGTMDRGGVEAFLMNTLRNIDREKYTFIFLCFEDKKYDYEDEIIALGGKIVRTPAVKKVGPFKHIKNIERVLRDEQIDIIHVHTYYNSMFSIIAGKRAGIKVRIVHSHNTMSEELPSLLKRVYFKVSRFIIGKYTTDYLACGQDAGEALFTKSKTFTIVDNGIILDDFYYRLDVRSRLRKELNIPVDYTVIMHVGRFDRQKNHDFLIDIYNEYVKLNPHSILILIGEGSLRTDIESKVNRLGIQENVAFLGKKTNVNELYNVADLFLFPSLHEGLPVTLVETQANGLVSLISDTIDKTTKFTACVNFYPLSHKAELWAKRISELNLNRVATKNVVEDSKYNMVKNVKKIEQLYENMIISKETL